MPFAYAGTRRRRNRARRRNADEHNTTQQEGPSGAEARDERDPVATRRASNPDVPVARDTQGSEAPPRGGSQDLLDPGSRDPDAPSTDNHS
nr:hypothetical protein [uncultured Cupriavidus sp.]